MASFKEIQAQIAQLQQQAAAQRENELAGAVWQIRDLMQEYGITVDVLRFCRVSKLRASNKMSFSTCASR